ncbi:MAG: hypothetical protein QMD36_06585 [Candidatus Aenigmarchaeota archaeon]|nr:hypothetical protein [Candidatus Aenigmarchaeota archaeon]
MIFTGVLLLAILLFSLYQRVDIIYFTNPKCLLTKNTDRIIEEVKEDFGDKVRVREIIVNMYEDDRPDTEEIKQLREKYQVYGVPEVIIDGKKFTLNFTKYNLETKICEKFVIKPEVCR